MRKVTLLLCALILLVTSSAWASPLSDLQHLLNNAGYSAGPADGFWGRKTSSALVGFAGQYGLDYTDPDQEPEESEIATILEAARTRLDDAYDAYPTQLLPENFFVGLGNQEFLFNEGSPTPAVVNRDGRRTNIFTNTYHSPADEDIPQFQATGAPVIRLQLGMEGALFFDQCGSRPLDGGPSAFDACYADAYSQAGSNGWTEQTGTLSDLTGNEIVMRFVDGVEFWNNAGFHVIVAPSDAYNGRGSQFDDSDAPGVEALFHSALMQDTAFQAFYPRFVGAVLDQLRQRGLTNISVQTANEPRFCDNSRPTRADLIAWTAIETAVIEQIRRVAPRISIVSSAICLEGVTYFGSGRPYSDLPNVMPDHGGIDGIAYSIHLYSPAALMEGGGNVSRYEAGTVIHYPFQPIPASAGLNESARYSIEVYNRLRPDAAYWQEVFADIAAFSAERSAPVMITEMNAAKPTFGLPREDRVALLRDLITISRQHEVPVFRFASTGYLGLSSCPFVLGVPDHRFDPALLNLIAFGNSVPGADPHAAIEPLEVQCGRPVEIMTTEVESHTASGATAIDSILKSTLSGFEGLTGGYDYNLRGVYASSVENIMQMDFTVITLAFDDGVPNGLRSCPGVSFPDWDGRPHLKFQMAAQAGSLEARGLDCILENTDGEIAALARLLGTNFDKIAADMVETGNVDSIANDNLRGWMHQIADGTISVAKPAN